jgi:hypothetical protein
MGAGYSKTRLDGKLHGEEGGVDNPIDLASLSDEEDAGPVAAGSSSCGRAVKVEDEEV